MINKGMKIGFIGCGNMASIIFSGWIKSGAVPSEDIYATDVVEARLNEARGLGIKTITNKSSNSGANEITRISDIIVIAVKPQNAKDLLLAISPRIENKMVITIMGGVKTSYIESFLTKARVVRVMPNTPMSVFEGCAGIAKGNSASKQDSALVLELFEPLGMAFELDESQIDSLTAISGCGPAFVYMFIDALALGGVELGLPYDLSLKLAAKTMLGSAKMVLEAGKHPSALLDEVCSPGGSTIAGVKSLELSAFKGAVMQAAITSKERMEAVAKES